LFYKVMTLSGNRIFSNCGTISSSTLHTFVRQMSSSMNKMFAEVAQGAESRASGGDASNKIILGRGCDPVMAERSQSFLPQLLGNAKLVSVTDDDVFIKLLKERKFDVVFFAPGACRWDAAKKPIPGGTKVTHGWGLKQYRDLVKELQGPDAIIVESTEEREVVPLLRKALKLPV
jgi:hypothetical protein